jgi:hypothetical protein
VGSVFGVLELHGVEVGLEVDDAVPAGEAL